MKFIFDIKNPQKQYVQITAHLKSEGAQTTIYMPAWRPGRYELGNFAKNVNHFQVRNEKGSPLAFKKINKNTWVVDSKDSQTLIVNYSYYATELNAGSTYLDAEQLYVNPVNCCIFTEQSTKEQIEVKLNVPDDWKIANSLPTKNKTFIAENFDELADTPFICSAELQHKTYTVEGVKFHLWFNGLIKPKWEVLISDFKKFTGVQLKSFSGFPVEEYHFLFQILPYKLYHGVEHKRSTVIALGPSYAVFEELYKELLGVSSHELYHTWNVKTIRPSDWFPYDFKQENYSTLGYIAEGITTYMGDLMLYRGGVFSLEQYLLEMNTQLQKHMDNFGRFNYSVAASSFDTWLDGYVPGAPGRKVSIYTEGCLLAFILDVYIIQKTNYQASLNDLMRVLYHTYARQEKGVRELDYKKEIEKLTGTNMDWYFDDFINGTKSYFNQLIDSFSALGLQLNFKPSSSELAAFLGAKATFDNHCVSIVACYPDSAIDKAGVMVGDQLVAINGVAVGSDVDRWVRFFDKDITHLTVNRKGKLLDLPITLSGKTYYQEYGLHPISEKMTAEQKATFEKWKR